MFSGSGRSGDPTRSGRMGMPGRGQFQEETVTDAQIDRIIKMYSSRHSPQETQTLEDQRKTLSREQFIRTLRNTAFFEYMDTMREEGEYKDLLNWFEKFTPDEAKGIKELKDENYDLYKKRLDTLRNKYRSLIINSRASDELMRVLVSDLQLELKQRDLTMQYWTATDPGKKESISADLKDVISQRYDLIVKQKEIQYTDFLKRLQRLQEDIDAQLKDINTWKETDFKAKEVETQLKNLTTTPTIFRRSPFGPSQPPWIPRNNPMPGTNTNSEPNSTSD